MNTVGLFAIGVVVTLIVGAALGLLVYGAILDGRYQAEHENADVLDLSTKRSGRRPAA